MEEQERDRGRVETLGEEGGVRRGAPEGVEALARLLVPHAHRPVAARAHHLPPVHAVEHAVHVRRVPPELLQHLAALQAVHPEGAVEGAREHVGGVLTERDACDAVRVRSVKALQAPPARDLPHLDAAVLSSCRAGGMTQQRGNSSLTAGEGSLAGRHVEGATVPRQMSRVHRAAFWV